MSAERARMTFGALLEALLGDRGMTRSALADKIGVGRAAIGKWITGVQDGKTRRPQVPTLETLTKTIHALELVDGERRMLEAAYLRAGQDDTRTRAPRTYARR